MTVKDSIIPTGWRFLPGHSVAGLRKRHGEEKDPVIALRLHGAAFGADRGGLAGAGFLHIDETPFQVGGSASSHAWVAVGGCMHVTVAGTRGGGRGPDRDSYYGG